MSVMRDAVRKGRVHCSTVHGEFAPEFARKFPAPPTIRALGVGHFADRAYAQSERAGGAHEHPLRRHHQGLVRRRRRPDAGARPAADQEDADTVAFHAAMQAACDAHAPSPVTTNTRSGATNISTCRTARKRAASAAFSTTGTTAATGMPDLAFTQDVGRAFLKIYPELVRRNYGAPCARKTARAVDPARTLRRIQSALRRGTIFGLKTGGNVDSILSSMPPEVKWRNGLSNPTHLPSFIFSNAVGVSTPST